ncbi:DUF1003 domain-containing protein [Acidicapsa ligni]|uniref:DUF1003 domain-containing protein n=1 Tax=Acidicapsa ligni TaxID=542300 RepID=UPI0021DFF543|nr:DUF1003 domain-containing protein [Acidicapsa ligni]
MSQSHLEEHVNLIAKHEQEFLNRRTYSEKIGDRMAGFIGSLTYVFIHIAAVCGWVAWNTLPYFHLRHFDLFPFPLLDTILAFEAILVASFILMRQSRMSRRADEREQLMLQVLLLTEREITAVLSVDRQIAERMGLREIADDEEIAEMSQQTSIDDVADTIKEILPTE